MIDPARRCEEAIGDDSLLPTRPARGDLAHDQPLSEEESGPGALRLDPTAAPTAHGGASGDGARAGVPTSITYNFKYNIAWHKPVTSGRTPATKSSRFAQFRVCLSARRQCPRHEILYGGSTGLVEYGIGAVQLHSRRQAGR